MSDSHILCLLDDDAERVAIAAALAGAGFRLDYAALDAAALVLPLDPLPSILLLRVHAEAPAVAAVRQLRHHHASAELPIVLLVDAGQDAVSEACLAAGADDLATMPVRGVELSARLRSQLARVTAIAAGRAERDRFVLAVAGSSDGIWDLQVEDDALFMSPRCQELLGRGPDDGLKRLDDWLAVIHPDDVDQFHVELRNHLEGVTLSLQMECRMLHKNQTYRWFLIRGTGQRRPNGKAFRVAGSLTDISERKLTDAMTGLPNRIVLYDRLNQTIVKNRRKSSANFGIILLQIDRFETMREAYGQVFCDAVQKVVAQRLVGTLRTTDTLTIMGENTMCILLDVMRDDTDLVRVSNRVRAAAEEPITLGDESVMLSLSIGMAQAQAHHQSAEDLIRDATAALNKARAEGGGQEVVFDPDMQRRARDRLRIEAELHLALKRRELLLLYQPIVDLRTGRTAGFEGLVRWQHPQRGMVPPMDFIPIAEETGLIIPMGTWVIEEAARQMREWLDAGINPNLFVSVNVSSRQLDGPALPEIVRQALRESRLDPVQMKLEITESAVMRDFDVVMKLLKRMREIGVGLSLDDFGTGYSSLSLLRRLPVDTLKVDQSFVSAMRGDVSGVRMVEAIIQLARLFDLKVVAEGIEHAEEQDLLKERACDFGQGWFYGKPLPAATCLERLLGEQAGKARAAR
ncbi:diguanylate cyclase (GGDEF)-like protein [Dongia mobilis]|uniref:Diguanylate cyclase (GGDEF)-like protein n=1 Tax=Dongia mobilis TaxID=578943 RepID=A0A4R6WKP3_9PROT|nr:EAL domain-containing protein [Dongia mobilis]TDQ80997.1 diguanylate cyclase (GGDEF)-like protein [Dongia mobilis]